MPSVTTPNKLDPDAIPTELCRLRRWVLWRIETRDGKPTKKPLQVNGHLASSTGPKTWTDYETALATYRDNPDKFNGIGFVFTEGDPYGGTDLDDCIDDEGNIAPAAQSVIDKLNSYTEISPSGRGVKIFYKAAKPGTRCKTTKVDGFKEIEIYDRERFFTITGNALPGTPTTIEPRQAELDAVYHQYFPVNTDNNGPARPKRPPPPRPTTRTSDDNLLDKARHTSNGSAFVNLFDQGSTEAYDGDDSSADLALVNMLTFWCGPNADSIDRLFRRSALYRAKWDEPRGDRTYGQRTIDTALESATEFYAKGRTGNGQAKHDTTYHRIGTGDAGQLELAARPVNLINQLKAEVTARLNGVEIHRDRVDFVSDRSRERFVQKIIQADRTIEPQAVGAEMLRIAEELSEQRENQEADPSQPRTADAPSIKCIAEAIQRNHHFAVDAGGKLHVYFNGVYKSHGERLVKRLVKAKLNESGQGDEWSSHYGREVAEYISVDAPELWERPPADVVNVANGLLNVKTRKLKTHDPKFLSAVQLPVKFDPEAPSPAIDTFVGQVFPEDSREVAYEIPALLMTPHTGTQKAVLLYGFGANGKSRYLALLVAWLGRANVAAISLHKLESDRFSPARLIGRLANICPDLPSEHLASSSTFKAVVGGDVMVAERKFQDSFEFVPFARLIFSANDLPRSSDGSDGFFRRWLVIPFSQVFDAENENEIPADRLDAMLAEPSELSGLLNRALEVLPNVRTRGITITRSMDEAWAEFRQTTEPLAVWLDTAVVDVPSGILSRKAMLGAYNRHADAKGLPRQNAVAFGRAVKRLRPNWTSGQRDVHGEKQWVWLGVGLREGGQ